MKKSPLLVFLSLALAGTGMAEAATPKKPPPYNQNRIGAYAVGAVGITSYGGDQTSTEDFLLDFMTQGNPAQNLEVGTEDGNLGYGAHFGYRFHKYFAAEIGLVKYGDLITTSSGEVDYDTFGTGFVPAKGELSFTAGGILMSALGVLPIGSKVELFGRVGYLFTSAEREYLVKSESSVLINGRVRSDTQEVVYGIGMGFNFNQVYALRAEYQVADGVGEGGVGSEDLTFLSLGLQIRF
jgi:hypothetical protein